jgi:hypothetical protein
MLTAAAAATTVAQHIGGHSKQQRNTRDRLITWLAKGSPQHVPWHWLDEAVRLAGRGNARRGDLLGPATQVRRQSAAQCLP